MKKTLRLSVSNVNAAIETFLRSIGEIRDSEDVTIELPVFRSANFIAVNLTKEKKTK